MIYGILWILGGLFLQFQDRLHLPITVPSWVVLVSLIVLSGVIMMSGGKKSDSDNDVSATADDDSDESSPSTSSQTASNSFGWGNWWLIALLILGVIGGMIWWVSTLPTSSSYTVPGIVYEDNSKKFVTFDIPKRWQQNSCFSLNTIINAKVVTIAGVDEVIKISPTNGRCWSGEKRVRHVTFRLADKSVSRVSVAFEKK
jgi:hypothetical protein